MLKGVYKTASGMIPQIKKPDILYQEFRESCTASTVGANIKIENNDSG